MQPFDRLVLATTSSGGVAVDGGEENVHSHEGEDHRGEADDGEPGGAFTPPVLAQPEVEVDGVDDPGDQRPGLLGVPGPVARPRLLRPDGAADDDDGEHQEAEDHHPVAEDVAHLRFGEDLVLLAALGVDEVDHADGAGQREGAVGEDRRTDVEGEPDRLQGGHEGAHRLALHRCVPHHEDRERHHERPDGAVAVEGVEDDEAQRDAPGEGEGEFILVAERKSARSDGSRRHGDGMECQPGDGGSDADLLDSLGEAGDPDEEEQRRRDIAGEGDGECDVLDTLVHSCQSFFVKAVFTLWWKTHPFLRLEV